MDLIVEMCFGSHLCGTDVFRRIDTCRIDIDLFEARPSEFQPVGPLFECSGDTTRPQFQSALDIGWHFVTDDDVRYREAAAGFNTLNASARTWSLSPDKLITQFEIITSTELLGRGISSISPFKNSTL